MLCEVWRYVCFWFTHQNSSQTLRIYTFIGGDYTQYKLCIHLCTQSLHDWCCSHPLVPFTPDIKLHFQHWILYLDDGWCTSSAFPQNSHPFLWWSQVYIAASMIFNGIASCNFYSWGQPRLRSSMILALEQKLLPKCKYEESTLTTFIHGHKVCLLKNTTQVFENHPDIWTEEILRKLN